MYYIGAEQPTNYMRSGVECLFIRVVCLFANYDPFVVWRNGTVEFMDHDNKSSTIAPNVGATRSANADNYL